MTNDEATKKIRELAQAGKVVFAPQDGIEQMQGLCDELLGLLGHPEAWVSDDSSLLDFVSFGKDGLHAQQESDLIYTRVAEHFAIQVAHKTHPRIVDILREINSKRNAPGVQ